jgi:hypothetical protein
MRQKYRRGVALALAMAAGFMSVVVSGALPVSAAPLGPGDPESTTQSVSPTSGNSSTTTNLILTGTTSCPGDSATGGYLWSTFMVPASADAAILQFDASGPMKTVTGTNAYNLSFAEPLFSPAGSPIVGMTTGVTSGLITPAVQFRLSVFPAAYVPAGQYKIGHACHKAGKVERYWQSTIVVATDNATGGPAKISWGVPQTLTVTKAGAGSGTVNSSVAGIDCGTTCSAPFMQGSSVTLTAVSADGSTFAGFSGGGCTGTLPTCTVTMSAAQTVTATFNALPASTTQSVSPLSGNSATTTTMSLSGTTTCPGDSSSSPTGGYLWSTFMVPATANVAILQFDANGPRKTVTGDNAYNLSFAEALYTPAGTPIVEMTTGLTTGLITPVAQFRLSVFPAAYVPAGQYKIGHACHKAGKVERYWQTPITVTTDNATGGPAKISWSVDTFTLTVSKAGTGSGSVSSSPAGITCGSTCSASFVQGSSVTLTATADTGSTFAGWSGGGCSGTSTCVVSMTEARSVTATFTLNTFNLTVSKAGTGSGSVSSSPAGITCGADCTETYNHGTSVTLTASAPVGTLFSGWGGACSGAAATCTVSMTQAQNVTATFVTVRVVPGAPTRVTGTPGNQQIVISWTPPSRPGDAPITGYQYSLNGSSTWTAFVPSQFGLASTTGTISGLTNGTRYSVRVRAVSAAGFGAASSSVSVTPRTIPGVPGNVVVTPSNRSLRISFAAPASTGGSSITRYEYSLDGGSTWRRGTTSRTITVSSLTNGTTYQVSVRAVNAAGNGPASSPAAGVPRTTPGAPTSIVVTPGNGQLTISWIAPVSNGGSAITGYQVSTNGGSSWTSVPASPTSFTVTGLVNGRNYSVRVRAVNAAGPGASSGSVSGRPVAQ